MTPRRNDPCPCGSGRKHKLCCGRSAVSDALPPEAVRLGSLMRQATRELQRFSARTVGPQGLAAAWQVYWQARPEEVAGMTPDDVADELESSPHTELFLTWFLLMWADERGEERAGYPRTDTIVARYLQGDARRASAAMRAFLEAWRHEPISVFEVREVRPGHGSLLRDLILDRNEFVHDIASSNKLARWDVTLAQLVGTDDCRILGTIAPYVVRRDKMAELKRVVQRIRRRQLRRPPDLLPFALDLIGAYHAIDPGAPAPAPQLSNTDGDPLEMTTSTFRVAKGEAPAVLARLAELFPDDGPDGDDGEPAAAGGNEFRWVREEGRGPLASSTLLGTLRLDGDRLTLECNSRARDARLRSRIEGELGPRVRHVGTKVEEVDVARLRRGASLRSVVGGKPAPAGERMPPELAAVQRQVMGQAIRDWADKPVPALGGKTPRQAARTKKGLVEVAELIKGWESMLGHNMGPDAHRADFDALRRDLGVGLD